MPTIEMKIRAFFFLAALHVTCSAFAVIKEPEFCKTIQNDKSPSLYLVDATDRLVLGPLLVGQITESSSTVADQILYPTQYRIIATPMRLSLLDMCTQGMCLKLTPTKSARQKAKTYAVQLGMSFLKPGGIRPYRFAGDGDIGGFKFEDPQSDYEAEVKYRFTPRIIGELVEKSN